MTAPHASSPQEATRRQLPAIDPQVSAWVEANAGTGKTKVLTDRIVRLLLDDVQPERILCLTFTKAAAAEMRNRLSATLGRWAFADTETLAGELETVLDRRPNEAATLVARRLFARVIDAPGGIAIQTIHSFCQTLLQRFPLEAGVAPNATVLDEAKSSELLDRAMDEQLRALAADDADPALRGALAIVGQRVTDTEYLGLMRALLHERGRLKRIAETADGIAAAERALCDQLGTGEVRDCASLLFGACGNDAFDSAGMARAASELARGSKTDIDRAHRLAPWLAAAPATRVELLPAYRRAFFTLKGEVTKQLATRAVQKSFPEILDVLQQEAWRLQALDQRVRALRLVEATLALLRLGVDIVERYEAYKRAAAALDYDDLVLRARLLLQNPDTAAWVLYKLDGGIDHVLIDEAQDTNPDQWDVASQLTGEFFAGRGTVDRPRTVFAVGDAKQSIFGFQRADPRKLAAMRETFRQRAENAGTELRKVDLIDSFRSTEAVLAAVDLVFAAPPACEGVADAPGDIRHLAIRAGQPGAVEVWPVVSDPDDDTAYTADAPPQDATTADQRLARAIVAHCKTLIGKVANSRTGAPLTAGDIMILVRRRNDLVPTLVRELKGADIPVSGVDRLALLGELAVQDLIALGRFVLLPQDDLNLACLLKSPLVGLGEDALFDLAHPRKGRLWQALRGRRTELAFAAAYERLAGWLGRADFTPPFEFFATVLGRDGARRSLLQRLGREALDPVDEFLALALRYQASEAPSLQGFLHWLEKGAGEIKRDLDQNRRPEVRILTVHASKGLQAPVVYLPDTVRVPIPTRDRLLWQGEELPPIWVPRAEDANDRALAVRQEIEQRGVEEHHRLLYVAMTRAADRLYICGATGSRKPDAGSWYTLVTNAFAAAGADDTAVDPLRPKPMKFDSTSWIGEEHGWQGDGWRLEHGDRPLDARPPTSAGTVTPPLPDWAAVAASGESEQPTPLAPSRAGLPDAAEPPVFSPLVEQAADRFKRGTLIHRLLQTLPDLPPARREDAARRYLRQAGHDIDDARADAWTAETMAVLTHPDAAALFGPSSRAEVPITGIVTRQGRDYAVSGQIDRLVVQAQEVAIVDYKTNRPPPVRPEDVAPLYRRQMALYREVLAQLYPSHRIRCFLLWTDGPRVMELPAAMMDESLAAAPA